MDHNLSPVANSEPAKGGPRGPAAAFYSLLILSPVLLAGYVMMHVEFKFNDILFKVIAAALGALSGCGGPTIVVTQYVSGRLSFGSVVAVLTATMGDVAFLLIA